MLTDKLISFILGVIFLLVLACEGPAAEKDTADAVPETRTRTLLHEPAFWDYAASSNMLQVALGKLAEQKASSAKLRGMAKDAVTYHAGALRQLQQLVSKQDNILLPDSLAGADQGLVQEMKLLEGEEFDLRYQEFIISTHNAQLDRYEEALVKADDQKIRDWIMDMRSHLRQEINAFSKLDSTGVADNALL